MAVKRVLKARPVKKVDPRTGKPDDRKGRDPRGGPADDVPMNPAVARCLKSGKPMAICRKMMGGKKSAPPPGKKFAPPGKPRTMPPGMPGGL